MIRQPHTAAREMIVAKAIEQVASELRLIDVADYVAYIRLERFAATYACRAAVKAGQRLDEREMRELLLRLFATDLPPHDVHGRSTIVQLPREELERRFGRR